MFPGFGIGYKNISSNHFCHIFIGSGGRSQKFSYVTLPSSPPSGIKCDPISENSLQFSWKKPIKEAPSINVDIYEYTHIIDGITNLTMDKVVNFDNLIPATNYTFSVKYKGGKKSVKIPVNGANCTDPEANCLEYKVDVESHSAMITCTTLPSRLTGLSHSKVTPTEIALNWNQYETIADDSIFLYYNVIVKKLLSNESAKILRSDINENYVASGLVEGTTYSISVSVVTTKGNSLPSDPITINTATFGINDKNRLIELEKKLNKLSKEFGQEKSPSGQQIKSLETKISNQDSKIRSLESEKANINPVMFSYYADTGTFYRGSTISFPKSLVNVGNSFNGTTFKCSMPGYYSFQFTGTGYSDNSRIQVLKNDEDVLYFFDDTASKAYQNDDESLMSFQFMLKLLRDDSVKLKVQEGKLFTSSLQNLIFNGQFMRPL